jgi:hypothetical protein
MRKVDGQRKPRKYKLGFVGFLGFIGLILGRDLLAFWDLGIHLSGILR